MELTDALGLETTPCEVGQTRARNGALQQVALPAAEEHAAADLFGGDVDECVMSRCGQLASVYYSTSLNFTESLRLKGSFVKVIHI